MMAVALKMWLVCCATQSLRTVGLLNNTLVAIDTCVKKACFVFYETFMLIFGRDNKVRLWANKSLITHNFTIQLVGYSLFHGARGNVDIITMLTIDIVV